MPRQKKPCLTPGIDRLSDLPDMLLILILSLLKTRQVVQMQVLSKRWRNISASVPILNFDLSEFSDEFFSVGSLKRFKRFVTQFLISYPKDSNLETFRFSSHDISDTNISYYVSRWILDAVKYNPKNIFIDFSGQNHLHLPDSIYTCESLEEIYLSIRLGDVIQSLMSYKSNLPKLRKFTVCNAYISDKYMANLISGCPNLEILIVENCVLRISGIWCESLKSLTIQGCHLYATTFCISTPQLLCFSFVGKMQSGIKLKDVSKVTHASICFDTGTNYNSDFLSNLLSVKDLKINGSFLKNLLEEESRKFPIFHNLKHLILGECCMNCAFGILTCFLEHTPKLERLTLFHNEEIFEFVGYNGAKNKNISGWFHCENLKIVEIVCAGFEANISAKRLVKRILQSTKRLDGVKVIVSER